MRRDWSTTEPDAAAYERLTTEPEPPEGFDPTDYPLTPAQRRRNLARREASR